MPRAERERLILDVAGHCFARDGYHSASMEEIAALAGVSKPMLYAYFGSKEGLYVAYINRTGGELVERLQRTFDPDDHSPGQLHSRVGEFLRFVEEYRDGWRVLFSEVSSSRPLAEEVAQLRGQVIEAVRQLTQAGLPAAVPEAAADAVAHAVVGAGESLANWWLTHPGVTREQLTSWYAEIVRAAVGGIVGGWLPPQARAASALH